MTITFQFSNEKDKNDFMVYMKEIYDYIGLDKECIPGAIQELDTDIIAYFIDDFFNYTYRFFIEQLMMGLSGSIKDQKYLELIAQYFRKGSEELLMSNIILDK